jgi:hypothetical protein
MPLRRNRFKFSVALSRSMPMARVRDFPAYPGSLQCAAVPFIDCAEGTKRSGQRRQLEVLKSHRRPPIYSPPARGPFGSLKLFMV